jgi:predicted acylesterase/phospholipase RssA
MSGKISAQPFGRIAICCSGGGYRAATFHLGALSYLNKLNFENQPLLENVKAISTVSGGTITGVVYALQRQQGKSFDEIYDFIVDKLRRVDLVRMGLAKLNEGASWDNPHKRKNLINAFAEIYDTEFTLGETFDVFENMHRCHLEEVMFNATDFRTGVIFRFQSGGRFGNYHQSVKRSVWEEVKLADVIAASSCFTGGFEPIEWPRDFIHSESLDLAEEAPLMHSVGLMDGGIYDNQGLDSILLAENRVATDPYDLIIVSDVTSPYMNPFKFLEDKGNTGWRKWNYAGVRSKVTRGYSRIKWGLLTLLIVSAIYLLIEGSDSLISGIMLSLGILALALLLTIQKIRKKIENYLLDVKTYLEKELADDIPLDDLKSLQFSKIPFKNLEPLIVDRIKSLITLVSEVFLKTVRRLVYGRLYLSEDHQFRRVSNLIRELTREDFEVKRERNRKEPDYFQNIPGCDPILLGTYDQVIGPKLQEVAETAAGFGTTLWFTQTEKLGDILNTLIACGQASMCFNLMKYLVELRFTPDNGYSDLPVEKKLEIENLWYQCLEDWKRFKGEPSFLTKS